MSNFFEEFLDGLLDAHENKIEDKKEQKETVEVNTDVAVIESNNAEITKNEVDQSNHSTEENTADKKHSESTLLDTSAVTESSGLIVDLFGNAEEPKEKVKGKATTSVKSKVQSGSDKPNKKAASTSTPKPKEEIKVNGEWRIHYATLNLLVSELFNEGEIPEEGVTLDQVREKLELDYPQFSKERTYWEYDKDEQRLFPIVRGTSKGGC